MSASRRAQREIDPFKGKAKPNYEVGSYVLRISSLRQVNQDEGGVRWGPPPCGMIGGIVETLASFEARYAPLSYPTGGRSATIVAIAVLNYSVHHRVFVMVLAGAAPCSSAQIRPPKVLDQSATVISRLPLDGAMVRV